MGSCPLQIGALGNPDVLNVTWSLPAIHLLGSTPMTSENALRARAPF